MALQWTDNWSTGVPEVDAQHQAIFAALNEFEAILDSGRHNSPEAEAVLDAIVRDTVSHFKFEEECMNRYRCPAAKANECAHTLFLKTVGEFQARIAREGMNASVLRELHTTAVKWVMMHILHTDVHLRACVTRRPE
jgi:hemerythrin